MKTYRIEVHSIGYEDTALEVRAENLQKASSGWNRRNAILKWCEHNDIDLDSNFDLPFIRISKV